MDMQNMGQPQAAAPQEGGDAKALLTQARALIDKALTAMGGEESAEGGMSAEEAFGEGFQGAGAGKY